MPRAPDHGPIEVDDRAGEGKLRPVGRPGDCVIEEHRRSLCAHLRSPRQHLPLRRPVGVHHPQAVVPVGDLRPIGRERRAPSRRSPNVPPPATVDADRVDPRHIEVRRRRIARLLAREHDPALAAGRGRCRSRPEQHDGQRKHGAGQLHAPMSIPTLAEEAAAPNPTPHVEHGKSLTGAAASRGRNPRCPAGPW